ncbi:cell division protein FtsZ [Psychromonas arctica]|uniref:cell division protein FtsZ n=1 Tax=Psychromonas arctica TaxID=168275 RepID=UPI00040FCA1A|nr:cell division protein FtsZ [Psychromonas arctica]
MSGENRIESNAVFELLEDNKQTAVIKVVGVGGGGGNAIQHMISAGLGGVEFIVMNTDLQALTPSGADIRVQLGVELTKGLGAGSNPEIGYQSALENIEQIREAIIGADIVFIAVGMGGGTGTGASPVVAEIAKECGALTIAVVTKPSSFEGNKRMSYAKQGIKQIGKHVDSLITLPNDKLQKILPKGISFLDALSASNSILHEAVAGFSAIINEEEGLINLDYADLRTINTGKGITCVMGVGKATGADRVVVAVQEAISCPLLENVALNNISRMLVHIVAGDDFSLEEFNLAGETLKTYTAEESEIIIGVTIRSNIKKDVHITVIATGLEDKKPIGEVLVSVDLVANKSEYLKKTELKKEFNHHMSEQISELNRPAYLHQPKYTDLAHFIKKRAK